MILPLIIAKWPPAPNVMDVTENAVGGISAPAWSVSPCEIFAAGFQPIGQKGLRLPLSILNELLLLTSSRDGSVARTSPAAIKNTKTNAKAFIAWGSRLSR